jgi:RHS repeat-associated protein
VLNSFSDNRVVTKNTLNNEGRLIKSITETYNGCKFGTVPDPSKLVHTDTTTYYYKGICFNDEYQKKTVPVKIISTQQYKNNGLPTTDTTTYGYSGINLAWMRQGNIDGSITTTYSNYTPAGLCGQKSVSAPGCATRTEKFVYDATQRFATKITNPRNDDAYFVYNPKTGNKLSETNANGLITTYTYDNFGNLTQISNPDGTITTDSVKWHINQSFPPNAKYYTKTASSGAPTLYVYYDVLGREVCRLDDGYYFDTRYNNKGQVTQTSYPYSATNTPDGNKIWTYFTYDAYGRKSTEICEAYTDISYSYNKRKTTITDNLRGVSSYKITDALGRIDTAYDAGGMITYNYSVITQNGKPRHQRQITSNGATTTIVSDLRGNRLKITEPNAGNIYSEYNGFNELIKQKDARWNLTTYQYDVLGRLTQKVYDTGMAVVDPNLPFERDTATRAGNDAITLTYFYDNSSPTNAGKGKLFYINVNDTLAEMFTYDTQSRLAKHSKRSYGMQSLNYLYNSYGQLQKLSYPGGFAVTYSYLPTGKLDEIKRYSDSSLIYKVNTRNEFHQTTNCQYGNGVVTNYSYNTYGLITGIQSGTNGAILNYSYGYDTKGLMTLRQETNANRKENFTYDNLDRLINYTYGPVKGTRPTTQTFSYAPNGNIASNSLLGNYDYGTTKSHAVTEIYPIGEEGFDTQNCTVKYNFFNQPTQITEISDSDTYELALSYGANQQRKQTTLTRDDTVINTRYYVSKYCEIEKDSAKQYYYNHFIYGDNGIVALHIAAIPGDTAISMGGDTDVLGDTTRGSIATDSIYYIHTDHLGSYCAITSPSKKIVQRNFFDPLGNTIAAPNFSLVPRGFTGHEHYPQFKIINMNGRLYDPVIARFFSPDMYVANSSFTQDFNRYSYARNNPLHYTDPSGHKLKWWQGLLIGLGVDMLTGGAISSAIITTGLTAAPLANNVSYEIQKYISPVAVKFSFGFGSRNHVGIDASFGLMKGFGMLPAYRWHGGASYFGGNNPYGGYKGWETRTGAEFSIGTIGISGTHFKAGDLEQITNKITWGGPFTNVSYENDMMFGIGKVLGRYEADGGDRLRTAAVGMNFGPFSLNLNMFTGDPGLRGLDDPSGTDRNVLNGFYVFGKNGEDPDKYRAGVLSFGIGPFRFGRNSEAIRNAFQNELIHKNIGSPYFTVLDIPPSWFWYFGTGSGNTLW